jgi:uncharacterized membrane protein HdeD (DUF308 family)
LAATDAGTLAIGRRRQTGATVGLGLGTFLLVVGLILVTGVIEYDIDFVEDTTLGWILLLAGVLSIILALVMNQQRSRTKHVEERRVDPR